MEQSIRLLDPAVSYNLLSLAEVKTALDIASGDTSNDPKLNQLIELISSDIAVLTNRVFGKERVEETFRFIDGQNRLWLSRWPVKAADIESVTAAGADVDDYELDEVSGRLQRSSWPEPVIVTYSGGYVLPGEAPPALKHAAILLTQDKVAQGGGSQISSGGVRMISHKQTRVMYYQATESKSSGAGGSTSSGTSRTVDSLLNHFIRIYV